jgi:RimJ/RimL family protein N-acetyltransferase
MQARNAAQTRTQEIRLIMVMDAGAGGRKSASRLILLIQVRVVLIECDTARSEAAPCRSASRLEQRAGRSSRDLGALFAPRLDMDNLQQTLDTPNLRLEPAVTTDFWNLWEIWSIPDIATRIFGNQPADSLDLAMDTFEVWTTGQEEGLGTWIIRSTSGQTLGCASLSRRPRPSSASGGSPVMPVDFRIALKPSARRWGFAREAASALIRDALGRSGLYFIRSLSTLDDIELTQFLTDLGFQVTGEYVDEVPVRLSLLLTRDSFHQALSMPAPLG